MNHLLNDFSDLLLSQRGGVSAIQLLNRFSPPSCLYEEETHVLNTLRASVKETIAKMEGVLEEMDKTLNRIESDLIGLKGELATLRSEIKADIKALGTKIDGNFTWTLGILISMWVTIIITVLLR